MSKTIMVVLHWLFIMVTCNFYQYFHPLCTQPTPGLGGSWKRIFGYKLRRILQARFHYCGPTISVRKPTETEWTDGNQGKLTTQPQTFLTNQLTSESKIKVQWHDITPTVWTCPHAVRLL